MERLKEILGPSFTAGPFNKVTEVLTEEGKQMFLVEEEGENDPYLIKRTNDPYLITKAYVDLLIGRDKKKN